MQENGRGPGNDNVVEKNHYTQGSRSVGNRDRRSGRIGGIERCKRV